MTIDTNNITVTAPTKKNDVVLSNVSYKNEEFILTLTKNLAENLHLTPNKAYIDISLPSDSPYISILQNLDNFFTTTVYENSEAWFGQKIPFEVIKDFYTPFLKEDFLRIKVPIKNGLPVEEIKINEKKKLCESMDFFETNKNKEVSFLVEIKGIRYNKQAFSPECILRGITEAATFNLLNIPDRKIDTSTLLITNNYNLDKFKTKRQSYIENLLEKKKTLDISIQNLETQKNILQEKIDEIYSETIDEKNYEYYTDDEFLEEEIDENCV
jgi:hypothetical protein